MAMRTVATFFEVKDPSSGALLVVWFVAAIVVIHDPAAKTQRYFMGHSEGIVSLAVDPSGTLAASAQCATVIKGHSQPLIIHVWDIETLEVKEEEGGRRVQKRSIKLGLCSGIIVQSNIHSVSNSDALPP